MSGFKSAGERASAERAVRLHNASRAMKFHDSLLDDQLRGILPHDLVLVGAGTGIGKTQQVLSIAMKNAQRGKRAHLFALEAEPNEIEMRIKYSMLAQLAYSARVPRVDELNYADWLFGHCEDIVEPFESDVVKFMREKLISLHTYYKGQVFDAKELQRQILDIASDTDLIVIDHLHYIDLDSADENEARAFASLIKTLRDVTLRIGKPTIVVGHLRKTDQRLARLVPHYNDFYGSSELSKVVTQIVVMERCYVVEPEHWYQSPTFMQVAKDRRLGALPFAAVVNFDVRTKQYDSTYTLGRLTKNATAWEAFTAENAPTWARNHVVPVKHPNSPSMPSAPPPTDPQGSFNV